MMITYTQINTIPGNFRRVKEHGVTSIINRSQHVKAMIINQIKKGLK